MTDQKFDFDGSFKSLQKDICDAKDMLKLSKSSYIGIKNGQLNSYSRLRSDLLNCGKLIASAKRHLSTMRKNRMIKRKANSGSFKKEEKENVKTKSDKVVSFENENSGYDVYSDSDGSRSDSESEPEVKIPEKKKKKTRRRRRRN
jgi:hypothetical protein